MTRILSISTALLLAALASAAELPHKAPLFRAHAHNDYLHARPLADALAHGFRSVEADIWFTNGGFLVAHDFEKTSKDRTLESLYLDPLRAFVKTNARVAGAPPITLLIDVKSRAEPTYAALHTILARYADILTRFESNSIHTNAVMAIISGNRDFDTMRQQTSRWAAFDGRLPDLEKDSPIPLTPLISDNFSQHFAWRGRGLMPAEERAKLRTLVSRTHAQGRRLRLWAAPDTEAGWKELFEAGVDLINTDKLGELENFLQAAESRRSPAPDAK